MKFPPGNTDEADIHFSSGTTVGRRVLPDCITTRRFPTSVTVDLDFMPLGVYVEPA
jgi:hypothetical protein